MTQLVLASNSATRHKLLHQAGLAFTVQTTPVDERQIEADWRPDSESHLPTPAQLAVRLASAKALASPAEQNALVIGADQITSIEDQILHKPRSVDQARQTLNLLQGKTHHLDTAFALRLNGAIIATHVERATLKFRPLSDDQINSYCRTHEDILLQSAGSYRIEGTSIHLFSSISGDYTGILGLPLLPLISALRDLKPELLPDYAYAP